MIFINDFMSASSASIILILAMVQVEIPLGWAGKTKESSFSGKNNALAQNKFQRGAGILVAGGMPAILAMNAQHLAAILFQLF